MYRYVTLIKLHTGVHLPVMYMSGVVTVTSCGPLVNSSACTLCVTLMACLSPLDVGHPCCGHCNTKSQHTVHIVVTCMVQCVWSPSLWQGVCIGVKASMPMYLLCG